MRLSSMALSGKWSKLFGYGFSCLATLLVLSSATAATTASPALGYVTSRGNIVVDGLEVQGNATLFNGSEVAASAVRSDVQLKNGTSMYLAPGSKVRIYADTVVLEQGMTVVQHSPNTLDVGGYRVTTRDAASAVQAEVGQSHIVTIGSRSGVAMVHNSTGVLLARLESGKALNFSPAPSSTTNAVRIQGVVSEHNGHLFLANHATGIDLELRAPAGSRLSDGDNVVIKGNLAGTDGAAPIVDVTEVAPLEAGGKDSAPPADPGGGQSAPSAGGAGAGIATGTIIAGSLIAVDAVLVGLLASGVFSSTVSQP